MEDGAETLMREENAQLAARTEKFITNLEHALIRIKIKRTVFVEKPEN